MNLFFDVAKFNKAAGNTVPHHIEPPINLALLKQAVAHLYEEARETADAHDLLTRFSGEPGSREHAQLVAEVADGAIDVIYVACNVLTGLGIYGEPLWDAVVAANMAKLPVVDGKRVVTRDANGKIIKPPGWVAPDHTERVLEQWNFFRGR